MGRDLSIDIETRSGEDIKEVGSYRYILDEEFEILLFAYAWDDEPVQIIDLKQGEELPEEIVDALTDPEVVKHAYNAAFEWYAINRFGIETPIQQWQCTMIHAMYLGYPAGLGLTGSAVGLPEDKQKLKTGKALIQYFSCPQKPTKKNGGRKYNDPQHDPARWELFKEYCKQDVLTEHEIYKRLRGFKVPYIEWCRWRSDVEMNANGVKVDRELIEGALAIKAMAEQEMFKEMVQLTELENPNSNVQLMGWLASQGVNVTNLTKETVADLLASEIPLKVRKMLELRQRYNKTSLSKYQTMQEAAWVDDRVRGVSQFYGSHTGRFAGRLIQTQNLPRTYIETLDDARALIRAKNYRGLKLVYGDVNDTLSQMIRTALIPSEGRKFVVADFSAIEARVIAWLAGEEWVNEVFATHGKIYEATASQMFNVPLELIAKGNPEYALRQKGKVATLALGYQGGTGSLVSMGALKQGLTEDELPDIVQRWRNANPHIVELWYAVEAAAKKCIETKGTYRVGKYLTFRFIGELMYGQTFLEIELPSRRSIYYPKPHLTENRFGKQAIGYYGLTNGKWCHQETYGGKLTENIVQAIARDCLCEVLDKVIWDHGYDVVFHVHDELIVDAQQELTVEKLCDIMAEPIWFAPGLILKGAGFEGAYYKKD